MFSTMTYTFIIASLFGSVCLTKPALQTNVTPTVEQIYKTEKYSETKYYQPVYHNDKNYLTTTIKSESSSIYVTLLNET